MGYLGSSALGGIARLGTGIAGRSKMASLIWLTFGISQPGLLLRPPQSFSTWPFSVTQASHSMAAGFKEGAFQ